MSIFTALFACFVGSAIAQIDNVALRARQTSASNSNCDLGPLKSSLPSVSPDFISYWDKNNPISIGCLAPVPTQFSSIQEEYKTWWHSHSSQFSSILSECDLGQFLGKRDIPTSYNIPPIPTSIPTGAISSLIDLTTSLPAEFAQFQSNFQPCSTTSGAGPLGTGVTLSTPIGTPTAIPAGYPAVNSTRSGSSSTGVPLFVSSGHHDTTSLATAAVMMAGVLAVIAAM